MARVVTFGEIMLRLAPNGYYRFFQNDQMQATFGGGEANVAVSLANYGLESSYVTKLPTHAIGQAAVDSLRYFGVDTSGIVRGGERVGIYFLEKGASQRGSVCIYDRAHSAIQTASREDFDWDSIFEGADWFHFTGITPALGANVVEICRDACKAAKAKGVKISCANMLMSAFPTKKMQKMFSASKQRIPTFTAVNSTTRVTSRLPSNLWINLALKRLPSPCVPLFLPVIMTGQVCSMTVKTIASPRAIICASLTVSAAAIPSAAV